MVMLGSVIKSVNGGQIIVDNGGVLRVSSDSEIETYNINSPATLSVSQADREVMRFAQSDTTSTQKIVYPSAYQGYTTDDDALVPKKYVDTTITDLELGNTYVSKSGDTMFGELVFDDNVVNAMKIAPVEGSVAYINYFDQPTTQLTAIDIKLSGNSDTNRFRILGGSSAANTMVSFTSSGKIVYNTDVSMNNLKITDVGNPVQDTDAVNLGTLTSITDTLDTQLDGKVSKTGGDRMEGPLNITTQPGMGPRDSRRINILGIYSNSASSSLQLGTTTTKIYVGNDDTSFNGPIKVSEISDRGAGIIIDATLKFNQHTDLLDIMPQNGTTQNINLFAGSNPDATTVKVNVNGATFKNALEFESGPSANKEVVLRIDSNKGLKARNLNMDDTNITKLADPTADPDQVYQQGSMWMMLLAMWKAISQRLQKKPVTP